MYLVIQVPSTQPSQIYTVSGIVTLNHACQYGRQQLCVYYIPVTGLHFTHKVTVRFIAGTCTVENYSTSTTVQSDSDHELKDVHTKLKGHLSVCI